MKEAVFLAQVAADGIQLNQEQREAVCHVEGPLVVFAGPGSGKTTVLTCRAAYLLQVAGIAPSELLVVTFTRAAAAEMGTRLGLLPGISNQAVRMAEIGTFHSVFMRMLVRQSGGNIPSLLEETEQRTIVRQILREQGQDGDDEEVADALQKIGLCKNNLILPDRIKANKAENQKFQELFARYEEIKQQANRWDYDDILVHCYQMLRDNPDVLAFYQRRFRYILVDEFQDTNLAQYEVIKLLGRHGNVCIVGDDDQSIYRFRGSRVEYLLDFESTFPGAKKVILATNYRSTDPVIETASRLILHNKKRQSKQIKGTGRSGDAPVLLRSEGERDEAEQILDAVVALTESGVEAKEIAVLYRTNIQVRAMIDGLVQRDLPFTLHDNDGDFYRRWQVRDVLTYMKLALQPDDLDGLVQIINRPKRYLYPERWVDEVHQLCKQHRWTPLQALQWVESLEPYQRVKVEQLSKDLAQMRFQTATAALRMIRKEIGYDRYLEEYADRTGNDLKLVSEPLEELEQAVTEYRTLQEFLTHVEEVNETIRKSRHIGDGVQLMTMHRAKGLEFQHVYCIGLVTDMLPHSKALQGEGEKLAAALEEERRLLYVAMTRAKSYLTLSAPQRYHGHKAEPSPFLYETGLLARPKRVAVSIQEESKKNKSATSQVQSVPAQERMQAALARYGDLQVGVGDTLQHKQLGPGVIEAVTPLTGQGGRRVELRFPGDEKKYDLHLELCLYLGLMQVPEKSLKVTTR